MSIVVSEKVYLGEERAPDGLDVGDLGGGDEGLELVGLHRKPQSASIRAIS